MSIAHKILVYMLSILLYFLFYLSTYQLPTKFKRTKNREQDHEIQTALFCGMSEQQTSTISCMMVFLLGQSLLFGSWWIRALYSIWTKVIQVRCFAWRSSTLSHRVPMGFNKLSVITFGSYVAYVFKNREIYFFRYRQLCWFWSKLGLVRAHLMSTNSSRDFL